MITLKLEKKFLSEIDKIVDDEGYQSRTEFIRQSLRSGVDEQKLRKAMAETAHLKGASKKRTTDEDLHRIREEVFWEMVERLKHDKRSPETRAAELRLKLFPKSPRA